MRKIETLIIILVLCISLSILFVSCGDDDHTDDYASQDDYTGDYTTQYNDDSFYYFTPYDSVYDGVPYDGINEYNEAIGDYLYEEYCKDEAQQYMESSFEEEMNKMYQKKYDEYIIEQYGY